MDRCIHGLLSITCAICQGLSDGAKTQAGTCGPTFFSMHCLRVDTIGAKDPTLENREIGDWAGDKKKGATNE